MIRPKGVLLILAILCVGAFAAGCGGDNGASEQEIQQARQEGAKEAKDQAKLDQLEAQVNGLAKKNRQSARNTNKPTATVSPVSPTTSSGAVSACTGGVGVGPNTSCEFAMNVAGEYGSNPGASSIQAYSPVTGEYYTMNCGPSGGGGTVCTGGNGASVYVP